MEPKSKKTLSLMINPGSKALPGGAASAGWGAKANKTDRNHEGCGKHSKEPTH